MGVKAQHLGFCNGCWPGEEVPHVGQQVQCLGERGTLGNGSCNLGAVSVGRGQAWVVLHLDGTLFYRVRSYQAFFLSSCDSELFR